MPTGLGWFVVDAALILRRPDLLARMAKSGLRVIVETIEWDDRLAALSGHHALQVKGHEAGGIVGEETSFILLQKALERQSAPVFVRGGVGLHGVAAIRAAGAAGVVLDDQLLLLKELSVAAALQAPLRDFTGLETGFVSTGNKQWRVFDKPGFQHLRQMRQSFPGTSADEGAERLLSCLGWDNPASQVVPLGQAAAFAKPLADRYSTFGRLAQGLLSESERRCVGRGRAGSSRRRTWGRREPRHQISDRARADDAGERRRRFRARRRRRRGAALVALALMQPDTVEKC